MQKIKVTSNQSGNERCNLRKQTPSCTDDVTSYYYVKSYRISSHYFSLSKSKRKALVISNVTSWLRTLCLQNTTDETFTNSLKKEKVQTSTIEPKSISNPSYKTGSTIVYHFDSQRNKNKRTLYTQDID